jgi:pSer/pThr/pTyr-binding forkhead associated (FHA) protein
MFKLVISDDEGKTTSVPLVRDEITIGRKEGNTIRLTDRNVSRRHAKLQKQNGAYVLQDLGSYNGTVINGTRLSDTRSIKTGDQIVIGDYKLAIVEENASQVAAATQSTPAASAAIETFEAPPSAGGHHPQATMPAIPSALSIPSAVIVPEHIKNLQLLFLAPAGTPGPFSLAKLPCLLGRSEIADVSLPFSSISREHAKVTLEGDQLMIEDLGSSNGITVNGERVKKKSIAAGDNITMGVVEMRVTRQGDATALIPAASVNIPAAEPAPATPQKKSSAGLLVGAGVLVAVLGGGGIMMATKGPAATTNPATNSTLVTGADPSTTTTATPAAQPAANPAANGAVAQPAANPTPEANPAANPTAQPTPREPQQAAPNGGDPPSNPGSSETTNPTVAQNDPPTRSGSESSSPTRRPRVPSSTSGTSDPPTARTQPSQTPTPNPTPAAAPSGQNAAQCLLAGDFQCVVTQLRGRAATEVEFNQLVTAYRSLHNQAAAEQTMRRYLSRFPDGRFAERYRDMLGQ